MGSWELLSLLFSDHHFQRKSVCMSQIEMFIEKVMFERYSHSTVSVIHQLPSPLSDSLQGVQERRRKFTMSPAWMSPQNLYNKGVIIRNVNT